MKDQTPDSVALFKALGDASRLNMLQLIQAEEPVSTEILCERLKLVPSTVSHHAKKLIQVQLIYTRKKDKTLYYHVKKEMLNMPLNTLIQSPSDYTDGRSDSYKNKVLDTFISCGKLLKIPSQRKKRRVILEHIVQGLDNDKTYPEKELSDILARWNEDYCFLRREMIAEGLLSREGGLYQRL